MNIFQNNIIKRTSKKILNSSVLKTAGIYTFANFANASIPFFLLPVLTRYLTPADYGITAIFAVIIGICNPFIILNIPTVISIKYFKITKDEFPEYVSNCLLVITFSCLVVAIFFVIFSRQIENLSNFPHEWLWAVIVVCFGTGIIWVLLAILQSKIKPYYFAAIQFLQTLLNMGFSVWFVVWLNMNWQGWVNAQVIAILVIAAISTSLLYKNGWMVFRYNFKYIKDAFKLGLPLIPGNTTYFFLFLADRFFIAKIAGLADVGIYSVGFQFSQIVGYIITSFQRAYSPWLFNKLNNATTQMKSKIVLLTYGYMISLFALTVATSYFIPGLLKVFVSKDFYGAVTIIFWAILARAFWGIGDNVGNYINYAERTHLMLWIDIPVSLLHLPLCYLLIKENGILGAAQANALTCLVRSLLVWFLSNKVYPMPWFSFYPKRLKEKEETNNDK